MDPVVKGDAPANETGKKGVGGVRVYSSGADRILQVQIDGTWYEVALTAV